MKGSPLSEEQISGMLREHEAGANRRGLPRHGISSATFYKWKAKYGGLTYRERAAVSPRRMRPAAEEAASGVDAGQRGAEGLVGKNV